MPILKAIVNYGVFGIIGDSFDYDLFFDILKVIYWLGNFGYYIYRAIDVDGENEAKDDKGKITIFIWNYDFRFYWTDLIWTLNLIYYGELYNNIPLH